MGPLGLIGLIWPVGLIGLIGLIRLIGLQFLTLRVSPPAHPGTTPWRVEVIREVRKRRRGSPN
eukprot:9407677-Pyramimonas_sp.AAC.1